MWEAGGWGPKGNLGVRRGTSGTESLTTVCQAGLSQEQSPDEHGKGGWGDSHGSGRTSGGISPQAAL